MAGRSCPERTTRVSWAYDSRVLGVRLAGSAEAAAVGAHGQREEDRGDAHAPEQNAKDASRLHDLRILSGKLEYFHFNSCELSQMMINRI